MEKHEAEYAFNCRFPKFILSGTTQAEVDMSAVNLDEKFKKPLNEIVGEFGYTTVSIFKNNSDREIGEFTYVLKITKEKDNMLKIFLADKHKNILGSNFNPKKDMEKATIIVKSVEQLDSWNKIFSKFIKSTVTTK